jgi:hypothetical protein
MIEMCDNKRSRKNQNGDEKRAGNQCGASPPPPAENKLNFTPNIHKHNSFYHSRQLKRQCGIKSFLLPNGD